MHPNPVSTTLACLALLGAAPWMLADEAPVQGAPLNLPAYSPRSLPGRGLDQHPFFYTGQWDFRHPVQRMVIVRSRS
jgi:hypothetical protein